MSSIIRKIDQPELFFGFVSPIGADLKSTIKEFKFYLNSAGYRVEEIKVTKVFKLIEPYVSPRQPLKEQPAYDRYASYIDYGNYLREYFGEPSILALSSIANIVRRRGKLQYSSDSERFSKVAYIIHQFKRKDEIDLLRNVYGPTFFQVSVYSRRGTRVDHLAKIFSSSEHTSDSKSRRSKAEEILQVDENQVGAVYGQQVGKIFHDADVIINIDTSESEIHNQVNKFLESIFSSNCISPSPQEYGMYLAKAASLRTLDLSRQVGAAIMTEHNEIISLGSNEVPKATGGTYWHGDKHDDREYVRGFDSNDKRKIEILSQVISILGLTKYRDDILSTDDIKDSEFMDALEFGRIIHAEMSAISDAARLGRAIKGATLYCTTFPCHMCAKHIVSSGISRVVFLEPYPKSLASDLHSDAIQVEKSDRGHFQDYPFVSFDHFFGITPRRYREFFERGKRKVNEVYVPYKDNHKRPFIELSAPLYQIGETKMIETFKHMVSKYFVFDDQAYD